MAKIGSLEVDTIQIAESAVSAFASRTGAGTLTVPNVAGLGLEVHVKGISSYSNPASGGGVDFTLQLSRASPSAVSYYSETWTSSGNTGGSPVQVYKSASILDLSPGTTPTYSVNHTVSVWSDAGGLVSAGMTSMLVAVIAKK